MSFASCAIYRKTNRRVKATHKLTQGVRRGEMGFTDSSSVQLQLCLCCMSLLHCTNQRFASKATCTLALWSAAP
eukprot:4965303-Amphidinium_carterae.2